MKYCPICEIEYFDYVNICNDCGSKLISFEEFEKLKKEKDESVKKGLVYIYSIENEQEADLIKDLFEKENIPFLILPNQETIHYVNVVLQKGWGKVFVEEGYEERAEDLIKEMQLSYSQNFILEEEEE